MLCLALGVSRFVLLCAKQSAGFRCALEQAGSDFEGIRVQGFGVLGRLMDNILPGSWLSHNGVAKKTLGTSGMVGAHTVRHITKIARCVGISGCARTCPSTVVALFRSEGTISCCAIDTHLLEGLLPLN